MYFYVMYAFTEDTTAVAVSCFTMALLPIVFIPLKIINFALQGKREAFKGSGVAPPQITPPPTKPVVHLPLPHTTQQVLYCIVWDFKILPVFNLAVF